MTPLRKDVRPNTALNETTPLVSPSGFREYDARWLYPEQINLLGIQALGAGLASYIKDSGKGPAIVVGHDYRSYSLTIKQALILGLMSAGAEVLDIGLALSPMAYFAQFDQEAAGVAMVTASHNENGWTGVKMGMDRPVTFGPDEMSALKAMVLDGRFRTDGRGSYRFVDGVKARYVADLTRGPKLTRKLKIVVACGNGTAGAFAPETLRAIGAEVIELDCELDYTFPKHNPNPEDMHMLHDLAETVKKTGADLGLAFDGDGDRCGVVDDKGEEIFADKIGLLLARDFAALHADAKFVVDVKSTGLFATDAVLARHGASVDYWKTGHSYIKRRVRDLGALAGFEKSGHFFFGPPVGRGYDDGLASGIAVCRLMDRNPGKSLSALREGLPLTFQSPTMAPHCADEAKYEVVDKVTRIYQDLAAKGETLLGARIRDVVTVNGVRVTLEDGTWGLVRASSNKPSLVIVVESPQSDARMRDMFKDIDTRLSAMPEVGEYDQKI